MPKNSEKWLRVIGIGEDGWEDLEADAKLLLYESQIVLGGERHLKMLPDDWKGERIFWTSPIRESVEKILSFRPDEFKNGNQNHEATSSIGNWSCKDSTY